jgi:hypothetical protein
MQQEHSSKIVLFVLLLECCFWSAAIGSVSAFAVLAMAYAYS